MKFEVHRATQRGITILEPEGALDETSSGELETVALEVMEEGGRLIVIDLAKASSASSHAFRMLLMLSKKLQSVGGRLVVCGARSRVDNALSLSGLKRLCCVKVDRDGALIELMVEDRIVRLAEIVSRLLGRAEKRRQALEAV
jgi:anti-anti-sigma factor